MSYTVADIQAAVQARGYATDLEGQQLTLIQSVLRRLYTMRRWKWLETTTTIAVTAGATTLNIPASVDRVDAVRLLEGTTIRHDLEYLHPAQLRSRWYTDRTPSLPRYWSFDRASGIMLWPIPDKAYTADVDILSKPTIPAAAVSIVPNAPDDYQDYIALKVCAELAARQRDWNAKNTWENDAATALRDLIQTHGLQQRQTSGEVDPWDGWEDVRR